MKQVNFKDLSVGDLFKLSLDSSSIFMKANDLGAVCTNSQNLFDCPMKLSSVVFIEEK